MTQPLPANNPVYRTSIFPNAVDQITNENPEIADAIMATQARLLGLGPAGVATTLNGPLLFSPHGVQNIGGIGTGGPANIYATGQVVANVLATWSGGTFSGTSLQYSSGGSALNSGSGAPAAGLGVNGDFYFRSDTPGTALQRIYVKSAGAWVGIV